MTIVTTIAEEETDKARHDPKTGPRPGMSGMQPPVARKLDHIRSAHGDAFNDPYDWMRDKESAEVRDYVSAQNDYCQSRTAGLQGLSATLFDELKSRVQETDMSVPTRIDGYWYFVRTQEGQQYATQCRIPIAGPEDWTPPQIDPKGDPGSMRGEEIVFDANLEAQGHDFFRLGGLDLSRDGRWLLYGVDTAGDERYDFRIRDLHDGTELPEVLHGIGGACFTPDAQWVFYAVLDDAWRPYAIRRHHVGTPVDAGRGGVPRGRRALLGGRGPELRRAAHRHRHQLEDQRRGVDAACGDARGGVPRLHSASGRRGIRCELRVLRRRGRAGRRHSARRRVSQRAQSEFRDRRHRHARA
jgi:oligopeptidase B